VVKRSAIGFIAGFVRISDNELRFRPDPSFSSFRKTSPSMDDFMRMTALPAGLFLFSGSSVSIAGVSAVVSFFF
jgi:hypothetical protein